MKIYATIGGAELVYKQKHLSPPKIFQELGIKCDSLEMCVCLLY